MVIEKSQPVIFEVLDEDRAEKAIERWQAHREVKILSAPRLTMFNGQVGSAADTTTTPFVVGFVERQPRQPLIRIISEGIVMHVRPQEGPDGKIKIEFSIRLSEIRKVETVEVSGSAGDKSATMQIPEVETTRVEGETELAARQWLLVGGLQFQTEKGKSEAVQVMMRTAKIGTQGDNKKPILKSEPLQQRMAERPLLQEVIIVGNETFLTSVLKKAADLEKGDAADPVAVENGRRKIEEYYQHKGYSKVRVTVLKGNKTGDQRAVFVVDEGPRQRTFLVNFVGNHFVSSQRLKTQIQSHPPYFYLFSGEVDRKQIDEDKAKLTAYYRAFGFFKASVGRYLEFNEKQNWLTITFVIDEGPRYSVRNVSFLGNKKLANSRLTEKLKLLSGQPFDQNQQNLDLQALRGEYGGDGYVVAKIKADNRFLEEPGKLDIVYKVEEGPRYRWQ